MPSPESETWTTLYIVDEISRSEVTRHIDGTLRLTITDALLASRMDGETRPEIVVHFSAAALHALASEWRASHASAPAPRKSLHPVLTRFRWFLESTAKRHSYVCDYIWLPTDKETAHYDTVYLLFDEPTYKRVKQQAQALAAQLWPREYRD